MDRRFGSNMPQVLEALQDTLRNVRDVSSTLISEEAASAIASTIAAAARSTARLIASVARAQESDELLPSLRLALNRLVVLATNDEHNGLFDSIAIPRFDQWPVVAQAHAMYDDELIYVLHDDRGNIFGSPDLTDGFVYLWYWDPRTAAAHLSMLRLKNELRDATTH